MGWERGMFLGSVVNNMGVKCEKAAVGSDADNNDIKENHHMGIGSECDLHGGVGISRLAIGEHTTYITVGLGSEVNDV
jgi:hypothetical protein